jgi:hypothetical protein
VKENKFFSDYDRRVERMQLEKMDHMKKLTFNCNQGLKGLYSQLSSGGDVIKYI